jgi:hypothetical protein
MMMGDPWVYGCVYHSSLRSSHPASAVFPPGQKINYVLKHPGIVLQISDPLDRTGWEETCGNLSMILIASSSPLPGLIYGKGFNPYLEHPRDRNDDSIGSDD